MPMPVRDIANKTFSPGRTAPRAGHIRRRPSLVEKDKTCGIKCCLQLRPGAAGFDYILALLLLGLEVLFLSVRPSRATTFQMTG